MHTFLRALAFAGVTALLGVPAAAQTANVVLVDGAWVTLGDVTGARGAAGAARIAAAPAPGGRSLLNVADVQDVAQRNNVPWDPQGARSIAVERAATVVTRETITEALARELASRSPGRLLLPEISNANFSLYVARGVAPTVRVEGFDYDSARGTFAATLIAPATGPDAQRVTVRGRVAEIVQVPTLIAPVAAGTAIRSADVGWIEVRAERVVQGTATTLDQLVGMTPRRPVRANEPVKMGDLQAPVIVAKNSTVTLIVETPGLQLTAVGRALGNGGVGDVVQVMNAQSRTTVEGVVEGPGRVRVTMRRPLQQQANAR